MTRNISASGKYYSNQDSEFNYTGYVNKSFFLYYPLMLILDV